MFYICYLDVRVCVVVVRLLVHLVYICASSCMLLYICVVMLTSGHTLIYIYIYIESATLLVTLCLSVLLAHKGESPILINHMQMLQEVIFLPYSSST